MCDSFAQEEFLCGSQFLDTEESAKICIPTQTHIRQQLGSKLSDVFFEYLGSEARAYLGLEPPLEGPDTVWVTPGSRIDQKVALTPVPEPEVLHWKALTHGSILEVGQKYLEKVENKHRMELQIALKRQAEELEEEFERRMTDSTNFQGGEGNVTCKKVVATLMEHFDTCFSDLVKTTQFRMRKECQIRIEEERAEVAGIMFAQMKEQLNRKDRELCSEFHDILYNELNILAGKYIKQINNEREIAVNLMKETVNTYEKMLQDVQKQMELSNIVDVCQAITRERVACNQRLKKQNVQAKENNSEEIILQLKEENSILQEVAKERLKRLLQWREKVQVLLLEFQRFINFAVQSTPGQTEFLLNFSKLLMQKTTEDKILLPKDHILCKKCVERKTSDIDYSEEPHQRQLEIITQMTKIKNAEETDSLDVYCQSIDYQEKDEESEFTFDYDKFKKSLAGKYSVEESKPKTKKRGKKRPVCVLKKKQKPVIFNKESEMYQAMVLAGETEREHMVPANCFLKKRLENVVNLCRNDPEFAKLMLGCFEK